MASYINSIPGALIYSVLIVEVQEAVYYFARLLKAEKETEALKKEALQTQLESLKQQVSPHFLFNNLNTLYYLIIFFPGLTREIPALIILDLYTSYVNINSSYNFSFSR